MKSLLISILLQGPPDDDWGDPDAVPINQDLWLLMAGGVLIGLFFLWKSRQQKIEKREA
jgi:hypothetical protein